MKNRSLLYWACQVGGWGMFAFGNFLIASIQNDPIGRILFFSLLIMSTGIGVTHLFRWWVHRRKWARLNIVNLLPRIALSSVLMSCVFYITNTLISLLPKSDWPEWHALVNRNFLLDILNFSALFLLWNIIYFAVKTFENWKREEIMNLELQAANTEIELTSFKSQMNPHFMFNALNSIRALVDENPTKAKEAITMLSGMLRNSLISGKKQLVSIQEEMDVVEKYLSLEKIRFEERLNLKIAVDASCVGCEIPPLMLQTIAENGVKHGISKRLEGGNIEVKAHREGDYLVVKVINSGQLSNERSVEGIGLSNTQKRLELLYHGKASFTMSEGEDVVITELRIPQTVH